MSKSQYAFNRLKFITLCLFFLSAIAYADDVGPVGDARVLSENQEHVKFETLGAPAKTMHDRLENAGGRKIFYDNWTVIASKSLMCGTRVVSQNTEYRCIFFIDNLGNFVEVPELSIAALIGVW